MNSRSASRTCLALRHVAFEDLGTLEPLFRDRGFRIRYIRAGAPCPSVREWLEADLCVVLGGPVGVGDTESYPYLKTELDLVRMRLESRAAFAGRMPRSSNDGPCPRQPRLSRKGQGNRVGNRIPDGGWAFVTTSLSGRGTRPALARGYVRCPFRSAPAGIHGGDSPSGFLRREGMPWLSSSMWRRMFPGWRSG